MKLVSLFAAAMMAITLTACSDSGSDNTAGAKAPAASSAPAAPKPKAGYDPEADDDGDC